MFTEVNINEKKTILLPEAADPDNDELTIDVSLTPQQLTWISFDSKAKSITVHPTEEKLTGLVIIKIILTDGTYEEEFYMTIIVKQGEKNQETSNQNND